jgi:hypothetical protein
MLPEEFTKCNVLFLATQVPLKFRSVERYKTIAQAKWAADGGVS